MLSMIADNLPEKYNENNIILYTMYYFVNIIYK